MAVIVGVRGEAALTVDSSHVVSGLGSANLPTLGTPALVGLLERAAVNAIRPGLEEGEETIGVTINLKQLASTPLGKRVRAEALVTSVDGRQISFAVRASDSVALVAEGTLVRAVVDREEFIWNAAARGAGR